MRSETDTCRTFETALPRIRLHAEIAFRTVPCIHRRADCIAEVVGLAWTWWQRLCRQGKDPSAFVSAIAAYAVKAVRSGRRVCGQEHAKDAFSGTAQRRHGFRVDGLPPYRTLAGSPLREALTDNTRTPPDEQAAFRIDFPAWLQTYDERRRCLLGQMVLGEQTQALAARFGLTPGRVSQLRRAFQHDWAVFCGEGN